MTRRLPLWALIALGAVVGCVSGGGDVGGDAGVGRGAVCVSVFPDERAMRRGETGPHGVVSQLDHFMDGQWTPVFRSLDAGWTLGCLSPGRYRLHFPARLDAGGHVVPLADEATVLLVEPGKVTAGQAVLRQLSRVRGFASVVMAVVGTLAEGEWSRQHALPRPPATDRGSREAGPARLLSTPSGTSWEWLGEGAPPRVVSHFPAGGSVVEGRRTRVVFVLSRPLVAETLEPGAVTVLGEASGVLPGRASYDRERWWLVWDPAGDLPRGDKFHATASRTVGADGSGVGLAEPCVFTFRTER